MTLARGSIGGYEYDRMVLKFSMLDGAREIPCAVSASAMDDLERVARTAPTQREEQFVRLRDRIEQCAARKFQADQVAARRAVRYACLNWKAGCKYKRRWRNSASAAPLPTDPQAQRDWRSATVSSLT